MTLEERVRALEAAQDRIQAQQDIWHVITRYARAIDENNDAELEAIFTDDVVFETKPWTGKPLHGKARTIRSFKDYIGKFAARKRFITNEQIDVSDANAATGWANWFVVQANNGESFTGWGCYDWDFRREANGWRISRMIITVDCMTTLDKGWGDVAALVASYPER